MANQRLSWIDPYGPEGGLPADSAAPSFEPTPTARISGGFTDADRRLIEAACRRPDLASLAAGLTIDRAPGLETPFAVGRGATVALAPQALANAPVLSACLRHACEITLLRRLVPGAWMGATDAVIALLACRAAGFYVALMGEPERAICRAQFPDWLADAYALTTAETLSTLSFARGARAVARLLGLQGSAAGGPDEAAWPGIIAQAAWLERLAAPTEHLLVGGGDARLRLDRATGLNAYECSPRPCPETITFASSTASPISVGAYREVEAIRQDLMSAALLGDFDASFGDAMESVRRDLLAACGAADLPGVEIVLANSGTDAELYALGFALPRPDDRLVNIVIAPDETGSGVVNAAGGRHFAGVTAFGGPVEAGAPVAGYVADRVRVAAIAGRDQAGALRPPAALGKIVEQEVEQAISGGARCLVHALDSSKTGWGAPGPDLLRRLARRHGAALDVVVDACQMRAGEGALRHYLDCGYMVQVTGSKFFGGPPFSGALIVPRGIARRADRLPPLPASLAAYGGRHEWPQGWDRLARALPARANIGLLLRWRAALWEMRAFRSVSPDSRADIIATFGAAVEAAIAAAPVLRAAIAPTPDRGPAAAEDAWPDLTTIFPFTVHRTEPGGGIRALTYDELRRAYRWLNRDIAAALPHRATQAEERIAARCCHFGQPVRIARDGEHWIGALRLCAGARLVSGTAFDPRLGDSPQARLARQIDDARLMLRKVALVVRYWDALDRADRAGRIPV